MPTGRLRRWTKIRCAARKTKHRGSDRIVASAQARAGWTTSRIRLPTSREEKARRATTPRQMFPRETPKKDVNVGNYHMDNKDLQRRALAIRVGASAGAGRSGRVPGPGGARRAPGRVCRGRANYLKVTEYDPGSHHAGSQKALRDPEIANAKPASGDDPSMNLPGTRHQPVSRSF